MFLDNSSKFNVLERTLDATAIRQKVIANNIANVDTPYFKRSDVVFEELLQENLSTQTTKAIEGYRTDPRHFYIGQNASFPNPQIIQDQKSSVNNNLNNVDIDYEMSLMAKNQLKYNTLIQQMNHELKQMRIAIEGGRS